MTVRVRYRANDLSEGVVEEIPWANQWEVLADDTLILLDVYDDDDGKKRKRKVGSVHRERWDSVVVIDEDAEAEAES